MPEFDLARTAAAFDVQPHVAVRARRHVVAMDTVANPAVGIVPWATGADRRVASGAALGVVPSGRQLVLVGRDNHRHPWVRDLIDAARREHPDLIAVDMGWPGDDRAYADVATFGASAHVGDALLDWLERTSEGQKGSTMNISEGVTNQ